MAKDDMDIEGDEEGAGGKKKLIIIIAAVVLLLGGGAAAFFLMGDDAPAEEGGEVAESAEAAPALEEGDPQYFALDPKLVVNLAPGGPAGMLQLAIQVYTRHAEVGEFLEKHSPMIRHNLVNLLEEQDSNTLLTLEGKQALQASVLELLKQKMVEMEQPGEIKGVYFTEFVLQ